ncbi:MAG: carboxymuconolactone decarboxylase family protein [Acidobacteria bacterium]|nr:carboxymuconolactone decarboxylase family protein [Acidobacteriota bacterium]
MQRLDYAKASPGALRALYGVHKFLEECGLDHNLLNLVVLRASQINGCAFCIDMHWKDAIVAGEDPQRLYMLDGWREWPEGYSERERAALGWTEAVTLVTQGHVPDEAYREAREQFTEPDLVNLTLAITAINSWNRMSIAFRKTAGTYQPARQPARA